MLTGDPIPELHHIAHYCKPWSVVDGMPTEQSFKVKAADHPDMSWNWLEYLSLDRDVAVSILRREPGAMTPEEDSCYAIALVGELKDLPATIPGKNYDAPSVLHTRMPDNDSHASVFSLTYNIGEKVIRLAIADMMTADDILPGLDP